MLYVIYAECRYVECRYTECRAANWYNAIRLNEVVHLNFELINSNQKLLRLKMHIKTDYIQLNEYLNVLPFLSIDSFNFDVFYPFSIKSIETKRSVRIENYFFC